MARVHSGVSISVVGAAFAALGVGVSGAGVHSFTLGNGTFMKDGEPFQVLSGSVHYFRHHPYQYVSRLQLAKDCGLNAVQTYVHWQIHEPKPGVYARLDELTSFLDAAQALGLLVLLRPG